MSMDTCKMYLPHTDVVCILTAFKAENQSPSCVSAFSYSIHNLLYLHYNPFFPLTQPLCTWNFTSLQSPLQRSSWVSLGLSSSHPLRTSRSKIYRVKKERSSSSQGALQASASSSPPSSSKQAGRSTSLAALNPKRGKASSRSKPRHMTPQASSSTYPSSSTI